MLRICVYRQKRNWTQKKVEAPKESEGKYHALIEQSQQGRVIAHGVPPRLVYANPVMVAISGYTSEGLASISMECLIPPDGRTVFFNSLKEHMEGKPTCSPNEYRAIRKDGKVVWIAMSSNWIEHNGQPAVHATFVDITRRGRAELEMSEKKWKLTDHLPVTVCEIDNEGKFTLLNEKGFETPIDRELPHSSL